LVRSPFLEWPFYSLLSLRATTFILFFFFLHFSMYPFLLNTLSRTQSFPTSDLERAGNVTTDFVNTATLGNPSHHYTTDQYLK
jgi:hypothetical protein